MAKKTACRGCAADEQPGGKLCPWCRVVADRVRGPIKKLKLSKEVTAVLVDIAVQIDAAHRDSIHALTEEVDAWRSYWCPRTKDRVYDSQNRLWWRRANGEEHALAKKGERFEPKPWTLVLAEPPAEIVALVRAARKSKDKAVQEALKAFEEIE